MLTFGFSSNHQTSRPSASRVFFGPASLCLAGRRSCQTLRCSITWSSTETICTSSGSAIPQPYAYLTDAISPGLLLELVNAADVARSDESDVLAGHAIEVV